MGGEERALIEDEAEKQQVHNKEKMGDEEKDDDRNNKTSKLMWGKEKSFNKLRSESLNWLRLRRVFDLFDKNGDGVITMDEITQALVLLGLALDSDSDSEQDLRTIVNSFIRPGNQGLDFQDFRALHNSFFINSSSSSLSLSLEDHQDDHDQQQQLDSDLMEAFKVFDSDGDGYISATELQQVLSKLGFPEAQQELHHIQLMISSFDHNHDGHVDFFEFKLMMSRTLLVPSILGSV